MRPTRPLSIPAYPSVPPTREGSWLSPIRFWILLYLLITPIVGLATFTPNGWALDGLARVFEVAALLAYGLYVVLKAATYGRPVPPSSRAGWFARCSAWLRTHSPERWGWLWSEDPAWYLRRGILRGVVLTLGLSTFLFPIYWERAIHHLSSGASDPLWLFYVLAAETMGRRHSTRAFVAMLGFVLVMLAVVTVLPMAAAGGSSLPVVLGALLAKCCWVSLLSLILHYHLRDERQHAAAERWVREVQQVILSKAQALIAAPPGQDGLEWEQELLGRMLRLLDERFDFAASAVWEYRPDGRFVLKAAGTNQCDGLNLQALRVRPGGFALQGKAGLVGEAIRVRAPRMTGDAHAESWYADEPAVLQAVCSELVVPIYLASETYGAIELKALEKGAFTHLDLLVVSVVADLFSQALANARWDARVASIAEQAVRGVSLTAQELYEVSATAAAALHEELDADVVTIFVRPPGSSVWDLAAAYGDLLDLEAFGRSATGRYPTIDAVVSRPVSEDYLHELLPSAPVEGSPVTGFAARERIRARASLRVLRHGQACVVVFLNFRDAATLTSFELQRLRLLGNLLAIVANSSAARPSEPAAQDEGTVDPERT
jgi:hypothetical protein